MYSHIKQPVLWLISTMTIIITTTNVRLGAPSIASSTLSASPIATIMSPPMTTPFRSRPLPTTLDVSSDSPIMQGM